MAYYSTCPHCGANLDPGEPCDCQEEGKKCAEFYKRITREARETGQLSFTLNSREVAGYEKTAY